jgi:hypothetical protein
MPEMLFGAAFPADVRTENEKTDRRVRTGILFQRER